MVTRNINPNLAECIGRVCLFSHNACNSQCRSLPQRVQDQFGGDGAQRPHLHHPQLPPRPHQIGLKVEWSSALAGLDEVAHAGAFGAHVFAVLLVDLGFKRDPFHDLQPIATQPRNLVGVIGG